MFDLYGPGYGLHGKFLRRTKPVSIHQTQDARLGRHPQRPASPRRAVRQQDNLLVLYPLTRQQVSPLACSTSHSGSCARSFTRTSNRLPISRIDADHDARA